MRRLNSLPGNWRSQGIFFLVTLFAASADQLSKLWVRNSLDLEQSWPEEGILRFTYVTNEGIIFGLNAPQMLSLVTPLVVIIAALFFYYYYFNRYTLSDSRLIKIGFGLVIGGSIGNLIDRFHFGYVTDFIDLRLWGDFHWPAFNLADSALVIGVILIAYLLLRLKTFQSTDPGKE
jgi:signal peptidase II